MFLVRSAFWLSVVILLLPAETENENAELSGVKYEVTAGKALVAAQSTMDDLSGFCLRNQMACETGKAAIDVFIKKAQYGAGILNDWVSGISSANAAPPKHEKLSSLLGHAGVTLVKADKKPEKLIQLTGNSLSSQQTLTAEDLRPVWGGPVIKRKA